MRKLVIVLVLLSPVIVYSQNYDCVSSFKWVKETFETNDAGYDYILEKKERLPIKNIIKNSIKD